jgi:hypothetical protein
VRHFKNYCLWKVDTASRKKSPSHLKALLSHPGEDRFPSNASTKTTDKNAEVHPAVFFQARH